MIVNFASALFLRLRDLVAKPCWDEEARRRGLVPVMDINWERVYAVDPEGRVVHSESGDWLDLCEETDPWARHLILARAAEMHPRLNSLRPIRGPADRDCSMCGGTGIRRNASKSCYCGGTGWIPADVPQPTWV
jgi:hypothetical protein